MNAQVPQPTRRRPAPRLGPAGIVAIVALALAAMGLATTKVHSADTFWHLACGQWMSANNEILDHDPFSVEGGRWLNVHWLFQVIVAAVHGLGGWAGLSLLKAAAVTGATIIFALALVRRSPPGWVVFCGLAMLLLTWSRFRVRPEVLALVLLMGLIALIEAARRDARALWLWPPAALMLLWANMQGVYVVGLGLIWAQVLAAQVDRQWRPHAGDNRLGGATVWAAALAATATCVMTPWHVEGLIHPFILWSRISGQQVYYSFGVSELAPTWRDLAGHLDMIAMVGLTLAALAAAGRRVPLAHWLWMAAFTLLALLAQRNIGLAAPVWAYLLALHGGDVLRRMGQSAPKLRPFATGFTVAVVAATIVVSILGATGAFHAWRGSGVRPGLGLLEYAYPTEAAKKLERLTVGGDVFCTDFGQAGVFIYHSGPRSQEPIRRVFMDGRLEAHSLDTFIEYRRIRRELGAAASASAVDLPASLRFFQVPADRGNQLAALGQSTRFDLLHVEPAGALFARNDWNGGPAAWRPSDRLPVLKADPTRPANNLGQYDLPLTADGLGGPFPRRRARRLSMNPPAIYYRMGSLLLSLAQRQDWSSPDVVAEKCAVLSLRYLTEARDVGIIDAQIATGRLAQAFHERAGQEQVMLPETSTPFDRMLVDLHLARSLYLFDRMPLSPMDLRVLALAVSSVQARVHGFQFDLAQQQVERINDQLPPRMRMDLPRQLTQLRDRIAGPVGQAIIDTRAAAFRSLSPREQALQLASPRMRLFGEAIDRLTAEGRTDPGNALLLGDLLLQTGQVDRARETYASIGASHRDAEAAQVRLLLCRWATGRLVAPADLLAQLAVSRDDDEARYYAALMLETIGRYDRALEIITPAGGQSGQARRLINALRGRLVRAAAW